MSRYRRKVAFGFVLPQVPESPPGIGFPLCDPQGVWGQTEFANTPFLRIGFLACECGAVRCFLVIAFPYSNYKVSCRAVWRMGPSFDPDVFVFIRISNGFCMFRKMISFRKNGFGSGFVSLACRFCTVKTMAGRFRDFVYFPFFLFVSTLQLPMDRFRVPRRVVSAQ